jgi:hypothetical protein
MRSGWIRVPPREHRLSNAVPSPCWSCDHNEAVVQGDQTGVVDTCVNLLTECPLSFCHISGIANAEFLTGSFESLVHKYELITEKERHKGAQTRQQVGAELAPLTLFTNPGTYMGLHLSLM